MKESSSDSFEHHRKIEESEYISNDENAQDRYEQWKAEDPFPGVQPSLLHSGQIRDYILKTGMLSPFEAGDIEKIKPASIEIPFEGQVVYWDENKEKWDNKVAAENSSTSKNFTLKRNSIAFVQVRPKFRLPYYIAIRFNLKITHVYRGLLLGTGPLVDPGYQGHLYIPLHNLTDNDYVFNAGEGLLWMEFTKLQWTNDERSSATIDPASSGVKYPEGYRPFPSSKVNLPLHSFFEKANKNKPIPSSIPQEIRSARVASEDAKKSANKSESYIKRLSVFSLISTLAVIVSLGLLFFETWGLVSAIQKDVRSEQADLQLEMEALSRELHEELQELRGKMDQIDDESADGAGQAVQVE